MIHQKLGKILVEGSVSKKWKDLRLGWTCIEGHNWGLSVALHAWKFMIETCQLVKKIFSLWWWIKKKMSSVYFEAHQCVLSKIHHAKLGKILVEDFETKMWKDLRVGLTCLHWRVNWGLCVALHASKIMIHVCRLVEKNSLCGGESKRRWHLYF